MSDREREIIETVLREREEDARFFSNKPEMERWVVRDFLAKLGVAFRPDEVVSRPEYDNVDAVFRDAQFQVKEIPDPAELRDDRVRQFLKLAREAVTPEDLYPPVVGRDMELADLRELIQSKADSIKFPPRERANLDLLCYVTRGHCGFNEDPAIVGQRLSGLGWRSISCLTGRRAYVLTSSSQASEFLRTRALASNPSVERAQKARRSVH